MIGTETHLQLLDTAVERRQPFKMKSRIIYFFIKKLGIVQVLANTRENVTTYGYNLDG